VAVFSGYPSNRFVKRYKSSFQLENGHLELHTATIFLKRTQILFLEYISVHFSFSTSIDNKRKNRSLRHTNFNSGW